MIRRLGYPGGRVACVLGSLTMFLVLAGVPGSTLHADPSVWTGKADYSPGETVDVHLAGFPAGATLDVVIIRPDGTIIKGDGNFHEPNHTYTCPGGAAECWDTVETDAAGACFYEYMLDCILGEYKVSVYPTPWSGDRDAAALATTTFTDAPMNTDFRQGANDDSGYSPPLGNIHWIGSILQQSNSVYTEGMLVPQRTLFNNVPSTTGDVHKLHFAHLATKSGIHAYDWLGSFPQAETVDEAFLTAFTGSPVNVTLNECGPVLGPPASLATVCSGLRSGTNFVDMNVPDDPFISKDGSTQTRINTFETCWGNRTIRIWGNAPIIATLTIVGHTDSNGTVIANGGDTGDTDIRYELQCASASTEILIEMAGHLAVGQETSLACGGWGAGLGASAISGGPYHFSLDDLLPQP